jgi:hypothetical protein
MKYTAEVYDGSLAIARPAGEHETFEEAAAACIAKGVELGLWPKSVTGRTSLDVTADDERSWEMYEGELGWIQTYGPDRARA